MTTYVLFVTTKRRSVEFHYDSLDKAVKQMEQESKAHLANDENQYISFQIIKLEK